MLVKHEWIEGLGRFPVSFAVPGNGPGAHQGGLCGTSTPALFNLCHLVAISPPRRKIVHRFLACFPAAFLKEPDYERVQSVSGFDGSIACVFEVVRTFFGSEAIEDCADSAPEGFAGSGRRVAHPVSGLGEGLFDGVQIRTLWRQEQKVSPGRADRLSGRLAFVAAEVVDHDHIARSQDRRECHELCVSVPVHAVSDTQASKRSPNIMANWLRAANHSRTFLPSFSNLRIAR